MKRSTFLKWTHNINHEFSYWHNYFLTNRKLVTCAARVRRDHIQSVYIGRKALRDDICPKFRNLCQRE